MSESPLHLICKFSPPLIPLTVNHQRLAERFQGVPYLKYGIIPSPVILFDLYGTLLQSASGDIGRFQSGTNEENISEDVAPQTLPNLLDPIEPAETLEPLRLLKPLEPFLPILPQDGTIQMLRSWFLQEVERRHRDLRSKHLVPEVRVEEVWSSILRLTEAEAFEFGLRFELTVNPVYPMPGAKKYLDYLKKEGIRFGIVSNAQAFTPLYVEALFGASLQDLGFLPELTFFSYELGESKPSPRIFQVAARALSSLGYLPEQALYIGNDLQNDVWAPRQVGFQSALFCGDGRSLRLYQEDPRFARVMPDYLIERFE